MINEQFKTNLNPATLRRYVNQGNVGCGRIHATVTVLESSDFRI
jgi:hypothetical protein